MCVVRYRNRPFAATSIQPQTSVLFTPARCEAVAAERAGGERGLLFAGQKAIRVHPSIAAASEASAATLRLALSAGRANVKKTPIRYIFVTGAEKGVRGKAPGLFHEGANRAPGVRGGAWRSQAVKPCIKKRRRPKVQNVCGVGVRYAYVCDECGTVSVAFYAAPEPLTRFFEVGGVNVLWGQAQSTPRRSTPRRRFAPPPEGAAASGFPLGLLLAGGRKERCASADVPLHFARLRSPGRSPGLARGANARPSVACAPNAWCALAPFSTHGAKSLPCGLRARRRPPRMKRV